MCVCMWLVAWFGGKFVILISLPIIGVLKNKKKFGSSSLKLCIYFCKVWVSKCTKFGILLCWKFSRRLLCKTNFLLKLQQHVYVLKYQLICKLQGVQDQNSLRKYWNLYLPTLCPKGSPISSSFSPLDIFPLIELDKFDLMIFLVLFLRRDFEPLALVEISTWSAEANVE